MFKEKESGAKLTMGKFLKNFGLGLVYIVLLPLLLVVLVLFGLYGLGVCIVQFFASTIRFFQGKEAFPPFWEDAKVAEIKQAQIAAQLSNPAPQQPTSSSPAGPSTIYVQQNYYNGQHNANGTTPTPTSAPSPIEANGYFRDPRNEAPTLDVSTPKSPALNQPATPALNQPATPQITANSPSNDPLGGYIDITSDDPKGGNN
jgi:hypothetical protein